MTERFRKNRLSRTLDEKEEIEGLNLGIITTPSQKTRKPKKKKGRKKKRKRENSVDNKERKGAEKSRATFLRPFNH